MFYSDLNGYGHFLPAVFWFRLYWSAFAMLLLVLAYVLWVRGRDAGWRGRLRTAAARFTPAVGSIAGAAAVAFVATGAWIYYNTHVLNPFHSRHDVQRMQADYERRFKSLTGIAQPKITAVDVHVDIYPQQHRARLAGTMTLVNKSAQPIGDLYVLYPKAATAHRVDIGVPARLADEVPDMRWHHYVLDTPLAPGATSEFR
jgi:hypothetical protein